MQAQHQHNRTIIRSCLLPLLLAAVMAADAWAGEWVATSHPSLAVSRTAGDINIDGQLDDPGWQGCRKATHFAEHQPGDQTEPPVATYALMTYDDGALYVAFMCYDDPSTIRASFGDRERIFNDDNVVLCLDTYGSASSAYTFNVNPYGIQADALWSPTQGEDGGFNMIWESAATITDSGYQVEMAIPFSALRFPKQESQVWRVDFWRNHPRETNRAYSWAKYDRNESCWPCQWGTVTGIEGVYPGKGIEIMPSVVAFQSGSLRGWGTDDNPFSFANDQADGEVSIGGKYSVSSDITVEGTYNPDFSQIEADATQIDVNSTFALFYPERRPFFQEGSDLFRTLFNSFYTRTINDPELAAKMTVRRGGTSFGYLLARDNNTPIMLPFEEFSADIPANRRPKSTVNVARLRQSIGRGSQLGLIATDRRIEGGGSGSVLATDGWLRVTPSLRFSWQAVLSHVEEPNDSNLTGSISRRALVNTDSGIVAMPLNDYTFWDDYTAKYDGQSYWGTGLIGVLSWQTRTWHLYTNYWQVSPTYRADNGYDPKNNRRDGSVSFGYRYRPSSSIFEWIDPNLNFGGVFNFDGIQKQRWVSLECQARLRQFQTYIHAGHWRSFERLRGIGFDQIRGITLDINSRLNDQLALGVSYQVNWEIARNFLVPRMANTKAIGLSADIKPLDRVLIEQSFNFSKADDVETGQELWDGYTYRVRLNYQVLRKLSLRMITEYDHFGEAWSVDPLLTFRLNPFSIFYIGTSQSYAQREGLAYTGSNLTTGQTQPIDETRLTSRQFFMKLQYLFQL